MILAVRAIAAWSTPTEWKVGMKDFGRICLALAASIAALLACAAAVFVLNPGLVLPVTYLFAFGLPATLVLASVGGIACGLARTPASEEPTLKADPRRVRLWVAAVLAAMAGYQFLERLAFAPYRSMSSWLVFLTLAIGAGVVLRLGLRTPPSKTTDVPMVETASEPT